MEKEEEMDVDEDVTPAERLRISLGLSNKNRGAGQSITTEPCASIEEDTKVVEEEQEQAPLMGKARALALLEAGRAIEAERATLMATETEASKQEVSTTRNHVTVEERSGASEPRSPSVSFRETCPSTGRDRRGSPSCSVSLSMASSIDSPGCHARMSAAMEYSKRMLADYEGGSEKKKMEEKEGEDGMFKEVKEDMEEIKTEEQTEMRVEEDIITEGSKWEILNEAHDNTEMEEKVKEMKETEAKYVEKTDEPLEMSAIHHDTEELSPMNTAEEKETSKKVSPSLKLTQILILLLM